MLNKPTNAAFFIGHATRGDRERITNVLRTAGYFTKKQTLTHFNKEASADIVSKKQKTYGAKLFFYVGLKPEQILLHARKIKDQSPEEKFIHIAFEVRGNWPSLIQEGVHCCPFGRDVVVLLKTIVYEPKTVAESINIEVAA